ncbi:unnamed protein product [Protopolystoma xenopodis]|uniref:Uncharacterized protein n=1 Tax=Protopolystoma xenopodis TaxID=117903 RepID=A0A448XFH0_9PLAT|nr:unnamed protein product [Protopolystoma xenopodis]
MAVHQTNLQTEYVRHVLFYLPPISSGHRAALNASLESSTMKSILPEDELERRRLFAEQMMRAIEARIQTKHWQAVKGYLVVGLEFYKS